jgi:hypothetical protein
MLSLIAFRILLAGIRNMGNCPCPRCLVTKADLHKLGSTSDRAQRVSKARVDDHIRRFNIAQARSAIYDDNLQVSSAAVESFLKPESLLPTRVCHSLFSIWDNLKVAQNAFCEKLTSLGLDVFAMFVVDLLHEFELGVGRAILIHLFRILETSDDTLLAEIDKRYFFTRSKH